MKEIRGRIHSIESMSAVDGPGIRTVIFFQGCTLRCKFCHNPDTWHTGGDTVSAEEVCSRVFRYKDYITDGGVTLSGGEPLLQAEFALEILDRLSEAGIHTAIETSGGILNEAAKRAIDACGLVIVDIKHTESKGYKEMCGANFAVLIKTLDYLRQTRKSFWVRQVIIEGVNDDEASILRLKELSRGAEKTELLPYHTLGTEKYAKIGIPYALAGVRATDKSVTDRCERLLKCYGKGTLPTK